jgi:flagellar basal-body rod protein FlgF
MNEMYQVLSSMTGQEQRIAQISNNLANINTVGFKRQNTAFEDMFKLAQQAAEADGSAPAGGQPANPAAPVFPVLGHSFTDYATGPLRGTGRGLDAAIEGKGFFMVRGDNGETLYTRAGDFSLDADGQLTTADGKPVLGAGGGSLTINPAGVAPQIAADGTVSQGSDVVGKLAVVDFADPQKLEWRGASRLAAPQGVVATPVADPNIHGGALEGSNVNAIGEMTGMIQVQRAYEVNQKVIQAIDDIVGKRISAAMS